MLLPTSFHMAPSAFMVAACVSQVALVAAYCSLTKRLKPEAARFFAGVPERSKTPLYAMAPRQRPHTCLSTLTDFECRLKVAPQSRHSYLCFAWIS